MKITSTILTTLSLVTIITAAPAPAPILALALAPVSTLAPATTPSELEDRQLLGLQLTNATIWISCNHIYQCIGTGTGKLSDLVTNPPAYSGSLTLSGSCVAGKCSWGSNLVGTAGTIIPLTITCNTPAFNACTAMYNANLSSIISNPQTIQAWDIGTFSGVCNAGVCKGTLIGSGGPSY